MSPWFITKKSATYEMKMVTTDNVNDGGNDCDDDGDVDGDNLHSKLEHGRPTSPPPS